VPLHVVLQRVGADLTARYVSFKFFDGYSTSIDVPSALYPWTILALDFLGKPPTSEWGTRVRLRMPTKLGFTSARNISAISITNIYPGDYWEDQGYDWFSGSGCMSVRFSRACA
jgi:DMSO/TMAO reductase YedYZ molybdopterin-dependent catalytic subunit